MPVPSFCHRGSFVSANALNSPRTGQELRRDITGKIGWILCGAALLLVIGPLVDIVGVVTWNGIAAFSPHLFTENTTGPNGGLANAIEGTFLIT